MSQNNSVTVGTNQSSQTPVQIHPHARDRWSERTPAEKSLDAAWEESLRVEAPQANANRTRLYAPYDALLVVRRGVLRTVLLNDGRISCPGLGPCGECETLIDPVAHETCRWCGAEVETACGRVRFSWGDKQ